MVDRVNITREQFEMVMLFSLITIPKDNGWKINRYRFPLYGRPFEPYWLGKSEYENFRVSMSTDLIYENEKLKVVTIELYEYSHEYEALLYVV